MESLFQHSVFPASSSLQVLILFPVLIATVGAPRIPAHWPNAYTGHTEVSPRGTAS
jgi:hypothetical protein